METIGNTAIQVSPDVPTEEEMGKVQDMFGRALNAVLAHADLTKKVDTLSRDLQTLTARLESEVRYAQNLNTSLTETREERDKYRIEAGRLADQLHVANGRIADLNEARKNQDERLTTAADTIDRLRRESDDHAFKALELDEALQAEREKVRKVQAELENFKANIEKVLGGMAQAMQTPSPEEQAYDKDPGSVGHAPGPSAYLRPETEEVAKSDPFPASETSTGAPTDPVSSVSEGQRAMDPSHPSVLEGSPPAPTAEAPSDAPSVGTSEPGGGGSQDKPWWERQQAEPEKPGPIPADPDYYR